MTFATRRSSTSASDDPNKIEIRTGSKTYFLTKGGEDWWSGSAKKMDAASVDDLLEKIRDLSADKFVDSGFTESQIDLTVTSNNAKRVEKVAIAKAGDKYIAKRENDATLYQLDAKAVDDLTKAADDLKPAGAPAK